MNTVWILIILYSAGHTNVVEFKSKENCKIAEDLIHKADQIGFCVEK